MLTEEWKAIPGYEGSYEASTHGRIRTSEGKTTYTERHGARHWQSRIMKGRGDNPTTGKRVGLWIDGKCKEWLVARLVAITFLGEPPEKFTVNHKDGNRMNNNLENLEWLSLGDNIRHGFETGLYPQIKIRLVNEDGYGIICRSLAQAGRMLGRSSQYISCCLKNNRKIKGIDGKVYTPF